MTIDAIALLKIAGWEPDDELDTRPLDDAHLLYLEVPFESEPEVIGEAIEALIGEALERHDDARGIFVLPDVADPDDAQSYEAVIAAAGEVGAWLRLADQGPLDMNSVVSQGVHTVLDDTLAAMGIGGVEEMKRLLQEGDPEKLQMMSIQMQRAFEAAARPPEPAGTTPEDKPRKPS
jgi:hypothetical protein